MKFTLAWAKVAAQNVTLKVATTILGIVVLAQLISITSLALRAPIVIERSCITKTLALASSTQHSNDEITAFLKEALPQRFDSDATVRTDFFSIDELSSREKEQAALQQKQMSQRFLFVDVSISGKEISVNGDRLIAIGKIKSVLPLALRVSLKKVNRTESNPYGLIIAEVSQTEEKKDGKK